MIVNILFILLGFVLLIKGADFLVDGSSDIAKKLKVSEMIIGLTIVSIGTSMPELFVNITSSLQGSYDITIGNIVGSNLCNLLLILGISTIITPLTFEKETKLIEIPICLAVTVLFGIFCNTSNGISRIEAIILLCLFILFITYTIIMAKKGKEFNKDENGNFKINEIAKNSTLKNIIIILLGIAGLKFGGDLVVNNSKEIATVLGLSEKFIGLTILAVGTSLPELVTSVTAAIKHNSDIAIGNIIGSNIFNILFIIGTSSIISPISYNKTYNVQFIILIFSTALLAILPFCQKKNQMSRIDGIIFTLIYIAYIALLFII